MRPEQDGRHFADNIFKLIIFNENVGILTQIPLNFIPMGPMIEKSALVWVRYMQTSKITKFYVKTEC